MDFKGFYKRVGYALKIIYNKQLYDNSVNFNYLLSEKENKLISESERHRLIVQDVRKSQQKRCEELAKKSYNQGYFDGEYNYSLYLKDEMKKKTSVEYESLDELIFDAELSRQFKGLKNKNYESEFSKMCLKNIGIFDEIIKPMVSYINDFERKKVEAAYAGACNGLINYFVLASNLKCFDNYSIIDTSFISRFREKYSIKSIVPKLLSEESEGLIVPVSVINEYHNILNSTTKNISRLKKIVKSDICQILSTPKLVLVPSFKAESFACLNWISAFTDMRDNGEIHLHKADFEICEFYRRFGRQFKQINLLSFDFGLNEKMAEISEGFNKNLSIIYRID
jgi:hypothetical protein